MKYVVIDLEMCFVPSQDVSKCGIRMEIIQLGATLLDDRFQIAKEFNAFVKPQYGIINTFIQHLTGIENKDIAEAEPLEKVLESLRHWLPYDEFTFVSWSKTDLAQLREELHSKNIHVPDENKIFNTRVDAQRVFSDRIQSRSAYKLNKALFMAGIDPVGTAHNGLSDAHNTAVLFSQMMQDKMEISAYYEKSVSEKKTLGYSLSDMMKYIQLLA